MLQSASSVDGSRGFQHQINVPHLGRRVNPPKLKRKLQLLDKTKVLYDPRTQTYEETNYLKENYNFWTELRYCMVLKLRPIGKPTTFGQNQGIVWSLDSNLWRNQLLKRKLQLLDKNKVLYGPRTQTYGETN